MEHIINLLNEKFRYQLLRIADFHVSIKMHTGRVFQVTDTLDVVENVGQGKLYKTTFAKWVEGILKGKKRDAEGNLS